jgi:DNA sulfur modification protein DndB
MTSKKEISNNAFTFTALRGIQSGREYYVAMCPLRLIPRIFLFNELEIPPHMRAQRTLNKARVPEMASYITKNNDYCFSSITASIDGEVQFKPMDEIGHKSKMGTLSVPMSARFLINDGQHRRAAIEKALAEKPELGSETISVVFFLDAGLKRSQQMFADLNKNAVKPTTSLNILYNHRDEFSRAIISQLNNVPIFGNKLTELEKTSISNRAKKVFTLNSIYHSTKALLGKTEKTPTISDDEKKIVSSFWNEIHNNIKEWQNVVNDKVTPYGLRQDYVHVSGVLLHAIGKMGHKLIKEYPDNWKIKLKNLQQIDWKKSNPIWEGRAMQNGRLSKVNTNLILTSNYLKQQMEIPLSKAEIEIEKIITGGSK